jgi:ubiquinone/menaquinone biosynthesis C-methylase UbiE
MSQCVGLDVSESMVEIYNVKAENEVSVQHIN